MTSSGEYFDTVEVQTPLPTTDFGRRFNAVMAEGIRVMSVREIPDQKSEQGDVAGTPQTIMWTFGRAGTISRITENGFPVLWHSVPWW